MLKSIHTKEKSALKKAKADMKKAGINCKFLTQENRILTFTKQTFAY